MSGKARARASGRESERERESVQDMYAPRWASGLAFKKYALSSKCYLMCVFFYTKTRS